MCKLCVSGWKINRFILIQDGVLRLNHDAGGIPTGNGFHIEMNFLMGMQSLTTFWFSKKHRDRTYCKRREKFEKIESRKFGPQTTERRFCEVRMRVVRG